MRQTVAIDQRTGHPILIDVPEDVFDEIELQERKLRKLLATPVEGKW